MKLIALLTLITLSFSGAWSQTIHGVITDDYGPLVEVEVRISGTDITTLTDEAGQYALTLPEGTITDVEISYDFFESYKILGLLLKKGQYQEMNIEMQTEQLHSQENVLSADQLIHSNSSTTTTPTFTQTH